MALPGRHHPGDRHAVLHDEHRGRRRARRRSRCATSFAAALPGGVGTDPGAPARSWPTRSGSSCIRTCCRSRTSRRYLPPFLLRPDRAMTMAAVRERDGTDRPSSSGSPTARSRSRSCRSVGARLHRLRAFGRDVLRAPRRPDGPTCATRGSGAATSMAPWCNRVEAGTATIGRSGGRPRPELPRRHGDPRPGLRPAVADEPATGPSAIDGRRRRDGWPWPYEVESG